MAESTAQAEGERPSFGAHVRALASSLWFPAFFFTGFLVCYLLPFHNPTPHHIDVAVAGPSAQQLDKALEQQSPGGFDIHQVADADAARQAVLDRDASAGFVPKAGESDLFVAKADGAQLETTLEKTFTAVAEGNGGNIKITDVAGTAPGDTTGTGLFYLVLSCTIPSYITVMMLLRLPTLGRRGKIAVLASIGAVMSVVAYFVAAYGMDVIPHEPLAIPIVFLMTQAVALTAYGLVPFCKQFFPGVALGIFILLSMPSSSGAVPIQMVPGFFRALHPILPMGNLIEALRGVFYFDGVDVWTHVWRLGAWVVVGCLLLLAGVWKERRAAAKESAAEQAEEEQEAPVEDPTFELPEPSAIPPHGRGRSGQQPELTGRVTDAHGAPLAGVSITVTRTHGREMVRATTDANGEYAAAGLAGNIVNVIASSPDRLAAVARVQVRDGHPVRQDFRLEPRSAHHSHQQPAH